MLDTFCQGPQVDFYSSQQNFLRRWNLGMGFTSPWTQVTRPRGNKCVKITPRSYFQFSSRFATHTNQLTSEIFLQQISTAEQWGKVSRAEEKPWDGFHLHKGRHRGKLRVSSSHCAWPPDFYTPQFGFLLLWVTCPVHDNLQPNSKDPCQCERLLVRY